MRLGTSSNCLLFGRQRAAAPLVHGGPIEAPPPTRIGGPIEAPPPMRIGGPLKERLMKLGYQQATIGFCVELTSPDSEVIPIANLLVGEAEGRQVAGGRAPRPRSPRSVAQGGAERHASARSSVRR